MNIPVPNPLNLSGANPVEEWRFFRAIYENFEVASGLNAKDIKVRTASLLTIIGADGFKLYDTIPWTTEEKESIKGILDGFEKHIVPPTNVIYERYLFNAAKQEDNETVDVFVYRLRKLIATCTYGNLSDEMLRDRLVFGIVNEATRKKLLTTSNLDLNTAITMCQLDEQTDIRLKQMKSTRERENNEEPVNKVMYKQKFNHCDYCGGEHQRTNRFNRYKCPAFGKICQKCGMKNHYTNVCLNSDNRMNNKHGDSRSNRTTYKRRNVRAIEEIERHENDSCTESDDNVEVCYMLNECKFHGSNKSKQKNSLLYAKLNFIINRERKNVSCLCDTGSTCNVIGITKLQQIIQRDPKLQPSNVNLRGFTGDMIKTLGTYPIICEIEGIQKKLIFQVVNINQKPLLSANTCQKLGLIKFKQVNSISAKNSSELLLSEFEDLFEGDGQMEGEIELEIDPNVKPIQQHPRRVPVTVRDDLKTLLKDLEARRMISKVDRHTEWTSNMLIVKKGDKLRLCVDPYELNKALLRPKYQIPTIEEILPELAKARIFTKLDLKNGFWQVKLHKNSRELTTFWTPFGRYCWNVLPFGLAPSPEIFQCRQKEIVEGLVGVEVLADDILVYGVGETEPEAIKDHDVKLKKLLLRLREKNVRLNKTKTKLALKSVNYYGHILSSNGLKADTDKIEAMKKMPRPTSIKEVQSLVGMATYLAKFLPNLSDVCEPIRRLTKSENEFKWGEEQEVSFAKIKQLASTTPILRYYDVKKPVVIQCDASSTGLGGTLLQESQPCMYISRALTKTEQNFAQIEKECLAILYSCVRFDQYLCGRRNIKVETDHLPLINIFKKPLVAAPKRLQRMILALQRYDITVVFKKGKDMHIADILSRSHLAEKTVETQEKREQIYSVEEKEKIFKEIECINVVQEIELEDENIKQIKKHTKDDHQMQTLYKMSSEGWPNNKENVPAELSQFWQHRHEIVTGNGLVFKGDRIIIPKALRQQMMEKLHYGHPGIEATLTRARETMYWPSMTEHIKNKLHNCEICIEFSPAQTRLPLQSTEIPERPFQRICLDLCELRSKSGNSKDMLLIISDYFSDWIEVDQMTSTTTDAIIKVCKQHFSRHGIPEIVVTDFGPQFRIDNQTFNRFAAEWGFRRTVSSPHHHEGNGKAESAVKIVKRIFKKADKCSQDRWLALLEWRNTPNATKSSPAQRLFSRRLRTSIPITVEKLEPEIQIDVPQKIELRRRTAKYHHDKKAKDLPELERGEDVFVQIRPKEPWTKAKVTEKLSSRTYQLEQNHHQYVRNRQHIKKRFVVATQSATRAPSPNIPRQLKRRSKSPVQHELENKKSRPREKATTQVTGQLRTRNIPNIVTIEQRPAASREEENHRPTAGNQNTTELRPKRDKKQPERFDEFLMYRNKQRGERERMLNERRSTTDPIRK